METKRKTPIQLQALENFYSEQKYPTQRAMEDYSVALGLTFKQVRGWFVEKRRKEKKDDAVTLSSLSSKKPPSSRERNGIKAPVGRKKLRHQDHSNHNRSRINSSLSSRYEHSSSVVETRVHERKKNMILIQDLLTPDYILKKVFRKDGPPLGVAFDSPPSQAFGCSKVSRKPNPVCREDQRATKRRKVSQFKTLTQENCNKKSAPVKKYGMGKALMTVWWATNPDGRDFPTGAVFSDTLVSSVPKMSNTAPKPLTRKKRLRQPVSVMIQRRLASKVNNKRKPSTKRREVVPDKENQKQLRKEKCELALEGMKSQERNDQYAMLADDEELELRELQAGPNPVTCSNHFAARGIHGCSLCKDLLAKFPPASVKMKQPFGMQPWVSSPEVVKKLFKVFHFLYTYSPTVDVFPFTLDEFTETFHDKDSLLLGKIHVALLKLLLNDVEADIQSRFLPRLDVSCKFLALLHSVENQEHVVEIWKKSLNPLTWTEILRQVLVAAGFGSKQGALRRDALSKELNLMMKYGLRPGTLKGELFRLLSEQGNKGLKVSELANSPQIVELKLASRTEALELLICSTLSSDITLFEKISASTYRVRINMIAKEDNDFQSDSEDSGSVDNDYTDGGACSCSDDSDCDSENLGPRKHKHIKCCKSKNTLLTVSTEIDESYTGEVWLLGLMEGEYSDLSIDEKLNALVAVIDLVSAGSSIRIEDPSKAMVECVPTIHHYGSGAKIKRSAKQHNFPRPSWVHAAQMQGVKEACRSSEFHPVDSSSVILKLHEKDFCSSRKDERATSAWVDPHPMQSVFLGSDRRYNRYWLFLGPCNADDPGHRRVYFESSEDGHWEVIDTDEALHALLLVLDDRGAREAVLIESLEKREAFLCQAMSTSTMNNSGIRHQTLSDQSELDTIRADSSSPVSDIDNNLTEVTNDLISPSEAIVIRAGKQREDHNQKWRRLQKFDCWIWNCFYLDLNAVKYSKKSYLDSLTRCERCHDLYWRDEKHCKICHTTFELDFDLEERYAVHAATCREKEGEVFPKHKVFPSQLQALKAAVHAIESVMPEVALVGAWRKSAHRLWVKRLRRTSSLAELLQVISDFVGAINEDWLYQCEIVQDSFTVVEEIIACFNTVPQTSAAVALWLVKLDAFIAPYLERVHSEKQKETRTKCTGAHDKKQQKS